MARLTRALTIMAAFALVIANAASGALAETKKPWRLADAIGVPEWLTLSGTQQTRFETLDGRFRAGRNGGDQVLAIRTTIFGEFRLDDLRLGVEFADARAESADAGTPLNTGIVNTLELLQGYVGLQSDDVFAEGATSILRAGASPWISAAAAWLRATAFEIPSTALPASTGIGPAPTTSRRASF